MGVVVTMFAEAVRAAVDDGAAAPSAPATVPLVDYLELERASEALLDALADRDRRIALMAPLVDQTLQWYDYGGPVRESRLGNAARKYRIAIAGESPAPHEIVNIETHASAPLPRHATAALARD